MVPLPLAFIYIQEPIILHCRPGAHWTEGDFGIVVDLSGVERLKRGQGLTVCAMQHFENGEIVVAGIGCGGSLTGC